MNPSDLSDSEKQEILKFLLEAEQDRTGEKLDARRKHLLLKITMFSARMVEQITKFIPEYPEQWIATGNSILHSAVHDYLRHLDQQGELQQAKAKVRLAILAQMARIMAMIDCYPDQYQKYEGFRNLSHDQFRKWLDEEYKKWLT